MKPFEIIEINNQLLLPNELAESLYNLDLKLFPTPWDINSWRNLFSDHDRFLLISKSEDQLIGFCLFDVSVGDSFAHLLKILVHTDFRKNGLAKNLLEQSLIELRKKGCTHFFLEVEESNLAAQNLYKNAEFQIIHTKKNFYGAGRSALIMTRGN